MAVERAMLVGYWLEQSLCFRIGFTFLEGLRLYC